MRALSAPLCGVAIVASSAASPSSAQAPAAPPPAAEAAISLPSLEFQPDADAESNYDKYFFFHRDGTDFDTAYADLRECDGYARGLTFRMGGSVPYPYAATLAGGIGGAIGNVLVDAIAGSAERRRMRRLNMRTCMRFKGYDAYGLPKAIWEQFNFEEGIGTVSEGRRLQFLRAQARAASGPAPRVGRIEE